MINAIYSKNIVDWTSLTCSRDSGQDDAAGLGVDGSAPCADSSAVRSDVSVARGDSAVGGVDRSDVTGDEAFHHDDTIGGRGDKV